MLDEIKDWKCFSDKKLRRIIEILILKLYERDITECKNDIDNVWEIVKSKDCLLNIKLRFGFLIFLGIIRHQYPYTLNNLLTENIIEDEVFITVLNGVIDCKRHADIFPVVVKEELHSQLHISLILFDTLIQGNSKEYYHMAFLAKRTWEMAELEYITSGTLPPFKNIEILVRFFLPLLDSSICGLPGLLFDLFTIVVKWAHNNENQDLTARRIVTFFAEDLLSEFFPSDTSDMLSFPLCKIHLRYLKIVVCGIGSKTILTKIPMLFEYLLHSSSVNYNAPLSGDVFTAALTTLKDCKTRNILVTMVSDYMMCGCEKLWYDDGSAELMSLNFAQFFLPSFVTHCVEEMCIISKELLKRLSSNISDCDKDHCLFFWISSFVIIYVRDKSINETESKCLLDCLAHNDDQIRIAAYRFVCDNYTPNFSHSSSINLATILHSCTNNLTSDNPSFRNHFISATKRLLISVRDSVIPHLVDPKSLTDDLGTVMHNELFSAESVRYLESLSWIEVRTRMDKVIHKDICLCLMFCRYVYCSQWFHLSMNYQRQKTMADLISSVREVFLDSQFFIDKKSGFSHKTVVSLRKFYRDIFGQYIVAPKHTLRIFVECLQISKPDVQTSFYRLLSLTHSDHPDLTKESIDLTELWSLSNTLCHSNQPSQLSSGSFLISFLSQCTYTPPSNLSVPDFLLCFLEELSQVDMTSVLDIALKRPGHGFLIATDLLLRERDCDSLLRSDRVAIAAIDTIKFMLKIMGCDQEELATFQKIGVTIASLAPSANSIDTHCEYQHILSWSWQVLRMAATILVNWCRVVDKDRNSSLFRDTGEALLRILFQSRHRGTIESASGCLQNYMQLAAASTNKGHWITAREVAVNECIDGAVRGHHSITRRSAGLPLVLMAALTACPGSADGRNLARDCLRRLLTLSREKTEGDHEVELCDPPIVHYLNLVRSMCQHPGLVLALQRDYGEVVLAALENFASSNWGVRNAALQLFTSMVSRLAALTRVNPTFGELFSLYPELWQPLLNIVDTGSQPSSSFHKHKTLVPALTLLANVQFCHDHLLPKPLAMDQLRQRLWPLLANEVLTVRRLAAKCISASLPNSPDSLELIKRNTRLIPSLLENKSHIAHVSLSCQHGELLLLDLVRKRLCLNSSAVSVDTVLEQCRLSLAKRCWILLDCYVAVLLDHDWPAVHRDVVCGWLRDHVGDVVRSPVGGECVAVSMTKLLIRLEPASAQLMATQFLCESNARILQLLCADFSAEEGRFMCDLFGSSPSVLWEHARACMLDYRAHYSPYVLHILATVVAHTRCLLLPAVLDQLVSLLVTTIESRKTETATLACTRILTFLLLNSDTDSAARAWFETLTENLRANVPESGRLIAAQCLTDTMSSARASKVVSLLAPRLAAVYTLGCYDECRAVRDQFRRSLLVISGGTSFRSNHVMTQADLRSLFSHLCRESLSSMEAMVLHVWAEVIATVVLLHREIESCRDKDGLYEPVAANIYAEDVFILEVLHGTLRELSFLDKGAIRRLVDLHPREVDLIKRNTDGSAFALSSSLRLLEDLLTS